MDNKSRWIDPSAVSLMSEYELKQELMLHLGKHLDSEKHTLPDLAARKVSADWGGLCGLAALYQSLAGTVFTPSQMKDLSYQSMKKELARYLGINGFSYSDKEILELFYQCKVCTNISVQLFVLFKMHATKKQGIRDLRLIKRKKRQNLQMRKSLQDLSRLNLPTNVV